MKDPREVLIEAQSALFEITELLVIAMKGQGWTREQAREHLEWLQADQDPRTKVSAAAQFDMIWPEAS